MKDYLKLIPGKSNAMEMSNHNGTDNGIPNGNSTNYTTKEKTKKVNKYINFSIYLISYRKYDNPTCIIVKKNHTMQTIFITFANCYENKIN